MDEREREREIKILDDATTFAAWFKKTFIGYKRNDGKSERSFQRDGQKFKKKLESFLHMIKSPFSLTSSKNFLLSTLRWDLIMTLNAFLISIIFSTWPFLNSLSSFTTFFSIFFLLSLSFCYSKEFNLNSPANFAYPFCLVCLPAIEQAAFDSQWCSCMDSKGQQIWYGNFRWLWNMKILRIFPYKKKVWHPKTCKTSLHVVSHILCLQGSLL